MWIDRRLIAGLGTALALVSAGAANAEEPGTVSGQGKILIPESSGIDAAKTGERMSTHLKVFLPAQRLSPRVGPPVGGYFIETPASLACIYGLALAQVGCNPNTDFTVATGGSRAIAVVDAYHDPYAVSDFDTYSAQFGLPQSGLTVVFANGHQPSVDSSGGWGLEASLDVQIAHAMAPHAKIYLVEATSSNTSDLLLAEQVAAGLVAQAGGGEVSNSWGGTEFGSQGSYDSDFIKNGVVFFASTGDSPGVSWPATSANVVAAGGTTTSRNPNTGAFLSEASWSEAGGGTSQVTARPTFQAKIASIVGNHRGVPDLAFDANPDTPVWVYFSGSVSGEPGGWWSVGGTSVASPALAGIVNAAASFRASSSAELTALYADLGSTAFSDETRGICGPYGGYSTQAGWDFCTGVGSPRGLAGK